MGNSEDGFFIGPETPGVPANWDDSSQAFKSFRDAEGRVLRQGARFRVFEYFDDGRSPIEVLPGGGDVADIEWRVHLANRKASFYVFHGQLGANDVFEGRSNIPAEKTIKEDPDRSNLRNPAIPAADRERLLDIDPGEQLISKGLNPGPVELTNSKPTIPIRSLGTLRLDEDGRLIALGGRGQSNSSEDPPRQITEYASNDTWFDDAGDGPVRARIRLRDGSSIDADPAWLIVGPPDFAPGIGNVVTLYDTLRDVAVRRVPVPQGQPRTPAIEEIARLQAAWKQNDEKGLGGIRLSFTRDIYPLLKRALGAPVTHESGIANPQFHVRTLADFRLLSSLRSEDVDAATDTREIVFNYLRNPDSDEVYWKGMPRGLGDDYTPLGDGDDAVAASFLSIPRVQYALMREWANGNFIDDWPGSEPISRPSPNPTPDELDQAAVENCVGGPFFPGIEISWLVRVPQLYREPFRLITDPRPESEQSGPPLRVGALEFRPGFFSQQMALPWQADFYDCHKEAHTEPGGPEYVFMWWTAHRPDDVYPSGGNAKVRWVRRFDNGLPPDEADALGRFERFAQMQQRWHELRFVSVRRGDGFEEEP